MEKEKLLYQEFLNGNRQAFDEIMDLYAENLIYFIQRYVGNVDIAQDIAQDTFVYILLNPDKYNQKYSLKTYLYTIAKSKAFNLLKKEKKILFLNENIVYENDEELEETIFRNERQKYLKMAMHQLTKNQQIAIYLADIEELPYQDVCKILKKSMPQVKMLIYRARRKLKAILGEEAEKYGG